MASEKVKILEDKGDKCVAKENHGEAVIHYTHALKLQPRQFKLLEKRADAFIKMGQYYYAYEDSKDLIYMDPNNPSGFIKKGLIESETGNYKLALSSYQKAYYLTKDSTIGETVRFLKEKSRKQDSSDKQIPWIGAAIGLVVGMALVVADYLIWLNNSFLRNPLIKVALIIANAYLFFHLLKWYRSYIASCRRSLLKPPPSLFSDDDSDSEFNKID